MKENIVLFLKVLFSIQFENESLKKIVIIFSWYCDGLLIQV